MRPLKKCSFLPRIAKIYANGARLVHYKTPIGRSNLMELDGMSGKNQKRR